MPTVVVNTANPAANIRSGWIAAFLSMCIWTGFILVTRLGGTGTLTSWDIAALRFGVGASIAVFFLPRILLPPFKVIVLFSLFGGIGYAVVVYAAFRMTPAAHASVLLPGALPFLTAIIAWLWLGLRPLRKRHIALVIVFSGIVLIAVDSFSRGPKLTHTQILGDLLLLCGSSSWAIFTLLLSRYPIRPLAATVATTLGSALVYLPIWWLFLPSTLEQAPVGEIAVQAIYQGVVVVFLAMLLYTFAVSRLGSQTVALLMAFVPVVSALAAVPLLGEPLSLLALAGLAAVTAGAILGARENHETEPGFECR
ncbi:EamA-like transporter family protein [Nitrosospira sp. Nsp11]|uniref:DMT family transporter n=1 Tax=Nitrosospira sp. Nsp11 TaxID=1855338 RepID=UPI000922E09B|nr:DMT family transporter [Nitrosospira sp. Nsp11]SHL54687.1 EamA-like transporter family protein [Nitrosospira sp. Nsp11]